MPKCIASALMFMTMLLVAGCGSSNPADNPDFVLAKTKLEAAIASRDAEVAKVEEKQKQQKPTNDLNAIAEVMDAGAQFRAKIPSLWRTMADAYIRAGGKANEIPHQREVNGVVLGEYGITQ